MINFGAAQTVCSGSWQVHFYADGVLRHTQSALDGEQTFNLPSGFRSRRWQITISGTGVFRELTVAVNRRELVGK
jgi:hypothetical protein